MRGSRIVVIEIYLTNQTGDKMLILYEGEILHTDSSTDILEHYGVKGMKWGKRLHKYKVDRIKRRSTELKAKNGDKLYLEKKTALSQKIIGSSTPYKNYTRLYNEKGERVGELGYGTKGVFNKRGEIKWNGVKEKYRGRGYSQSAFNEVENRIKKKRGVKEIRLNSVPRKDALHIYEKNGYVKDKRKNISNDVSRLFGLEPMVKKVR